MTSHPRPTSLRLCAALRVIVFGTALVAAVPHDAFGADLQPLVDRAIRSGQSEVRLPPGRQVSDRALRVVDAKNLTIRATGTRLVLANPVSAGVVVRRSTNVRIIGLAIDYDPLPFTQGRIIRADPGAGAYDIRLDRGYGFASRRFPGLVADLHIADARVVRPALRAGSVYQGTVRALTRDVVRWTAPPGASMAFYDIRTGDRAAVAATWSRCAVESIDSRATRLEDVRVAAAPGCGVGETRGGGTRMRAVVGPAGPPRGATAPRLLSTNRDGIHSSGAQPGPLIERTVIRATGDDGINIENRMSKIVERDGPQIVREPDFPPLAPGDRVLTYDPKTLRVSGDGRIRTVKGARVTLDGADGALVGHWLVAPRYGTGGIVRSTQIFGPARCGVVARGRDVRVVRSRVQFAGVCGIWVGGELGGFQEGDFASGAIIAGNVLQNIGASRNAVGDFQPLLGAITIGPVGPDTAQGYEAWNGSRPVRRIRVVGNQVAQTALFGLFITGSQEITVCENRFTGTNSQSRRRAGALFAFAPARPIGIRDSGAATFAGNTPVGPDILQVDGTADATTIGFQAACPPRTNG
jgi:hypothetical protein